jgi:hypothetical protein
MEQRKIVKREENETEKTRKVEGREGVKEDWGKRDENEETRVMEIAESDAPLLCSSRRMLW